MKTRSFSAILLCFFIVMTFSTCRRIKVTRTDTEKSGYAQIASDDCFAPIVKEELDVFTGLNPEAEVQPIYTGEKEVYELLLKDSIRLIIGTRELNEAEVAQIKAKKLSPRTLRLAGDGLALIINRANTDSIMSTQTLKKIMTGEITDWKELSPNKKSKLGQIQVVFDNPSSSTLRYIEENITSGQPLHNSLRALNTNVEVIEHVQKTPNALGIIGVNWISNPNDSTKLSFNSTIRVMAVGKSDEATIDNTFKPFPVYLNNGDYPLTRNVYIIITDLRETLPSGVMKFFASDAGQRIILKAGLVPGTRPTRDIVLHDSF